MKNTNDNKFLRSVSIHLEQFNCFVTKKSFEKKICRRLNTLSYSNIHSSEQLIRTQLGIYIYRAFLQKQFTVLAVNDFRIILHCRFSTGF